MKIIDVFFKFLGLGCISFGGPMAHIGYFQTMFVDRLNWLDQKAYARLMALSQFLPGPASSQIGFAIGLERAGVLGGVAAFIGFTLPSMIIMLALALATEFSEFMIYYPKIVYGLKLLAVVVVADALLKMAKSFCKRFITFLISVLSLSLFLYFPKIEFQISVLILAAFVGIFFAKKEQKEIKVPFKINYLFLSVFIFLLIGLPFFSAFHPLLKLGNSFYKVGSMVFGGGHVVLPLLKESLGSSVSTDQFLSGYGVAQGVPGPMFSFAAFLGAILVKGTLVQKIVGGIVALISIFLPGFLLVLGLKKSWDAIASRSMFSGAISGINAAVVGLLGAAFYNPIFITSVKSVTELCIVIVGVVLLIRYKIPILILLILFSCLGFLV